MTGPSDVDALVAEARARVRPTDDETTLPDALTAASAGLLRAAAAAAPSEAAALRAEAFLLALDVAADLLPRHPDPVAQLGAGAVSTLEDAAAQTEDVIDALVARLSPDRWLRQIGEPLTEATIDPTTLLVALHPVALAGVRRYLRVRAVLEAWSASDAGGRLELVRDALRARDAAFVDQPLARRIWPLHHLARELGVAHLVPSLTQALGAPLLDGFVTSLAAEAARTGSLARITERLLTEAAADRLGDTDLDLCRSAIAAPGGLLRAVHRKAWNDRFVRHVYERPLPERSSHRARACPRVPSGARITPAELLGARGARPPQRDEQRPMVALAHAAPWRVVRTPVRASALARLALVEVSIAVAGAHLLVFGDDDGLWCLVERRDEPDRWVTGVARVAEVPWVEGDRRGSTGATTGLAGLGAHDPRPARDPRELAPRIRPTRLGPLRSFFAGSGGHVDRSISPRAHVLLTDPPTGDRTPPPADPGGDRAAVDGDLFVVLAPRPAGLDTAARVAARLTRRFPRSPVRRVPWAPGAGVREARTSTTLAASTPEARSGPAMTMRHEVADLDAVVENLMVDAGADPVLYVSTMNPWTAVAFVEAARRRVVPCVVHDPGARARVLFPYDEAVLSEAAAEAEADSGCLESSLVRRSRERVAAPWLVPVGPELVAAFEGPSRRGRRPDPAGVLLDWILDQPEEARQTCGALDVLDALIAWLHRSSTPERARIALLAAPGSRARRGALALSRYLTDRGITACCPMPPRRHDSSWAWERYLRRIAGARGAVLASTSPAWVAVVFHAARALGIPVYAGRPVAMQGADMPFDELPSLMVDRPPTWVCPRRVPAGSRRGGSRRPSEPSTEP